MNLVEIALYITSWITGLTCGFMAARRHERLAFVFGVITAIVIVVNVSLSSW